ncbi:MAG: SIR2 family protein [Deltaproteobacteria bacterium]|nr:SIR2 family protein [Deltaproteobacteria bacterium]
MPEAEQAQALVEALSPSEPLDAHYTRVLKAIVDGRVVPFLGAGVNLWERLPAGPWRRGQDLPSGGQLSTYLIEEFDYPKEETADLLRVSQYVTVMTGSGPLYEKLHILFDADYPPTPLHEFFATLPSALCKKESPPRYQLLVTTNYDDVLERAFLAAGESFDVITYMADGDHSRKFLHRLPDGEIRLIDRPNEYVALPIEMPSLVMKRPVILKIHGTVDRVEPERDSYVITEDHYIDYLTHTNISNLMPKALVAKLTRSHFLFLGYSLRDWNLRVILRRLWGERKLTYKSWAIQKDPDRLEREFWSKRDVDIYAVSLENYIAALNKRVDALPRAASAP